MKTLLSWFLAIAIVLGLGGLFLYKYYLPGMIGEAVVKDEIPAYVPDYMKSKMVKYKAPLNKGADDVIRQIHQANVPLDQVLGAIDKTDEAQINAMISEIQMSDVQSTDQVFNIAKRHLDPGFDIEVLREPFNKNVNIKMIRKALDESNQNAERTVDTDMAKAILKNILVQKEHEYNRKLADQQ